MILNWVNIIELIMVLLSLLLELWEIIEKLMQ